MIDSYKNSDPLIMRKKFSVCDTVYRRDLPEHELLRAELAYDTEFCVLTAVIAASAVTALLCIAGWRKRAHLRHLERKIEKSKRRS